jgi:hypothetical protein
MRESCVERRAALLAPTAITARHQQAAVGEIEKTFGFGARFEMPRDRTPGIAVCTENLNTGVVVMKVRPEWRVNRSHRSQPSHIAPLQSDMARRYRSGPALP